MHDVAILQTLRLGHEGSFMQVGVEFLSLAILGTVGRVESLQTVPLERAHENVLGHFQTRHQFLQVLVLLGRSSTELVLWHGKQGAVEVVNAFEQVSGEFLDGEVTGGLHVPLSALLEVEEIGD